MPLKNKADQKTTRDAEEFLPKPPDRKEYERAMGAIRERLKEIDTELRILQRSRSSDSPQYSSAGVDLSSEEQVEAEKEKLREEKDTIVRTQKELEQSLQRVATGITSKRNQSTRLKANLRYSTEEQHLSAIRRLEEQLATKRYSKAEEGKIEDEIKELTQSKGILKEHEEIEKEVEALKTEQKQLREEKKSLFRQMSSVTDREKTFAKLQRSKSSDTSVPNFHTMSESDIGLYRTKLREEMEQLNGQQVRLIQDFKAKENEYLAKLDIAKVKRKEEKEKKAEEKKLKEVERKSREVYKRVEGLSDIPVLEAKKGRDCCMSLITHLQKNCKLLKAEASPEGSLQLKESSQEMSSDQSEDKKHKLQDWEDEEGVFLKKKQDGDDYFMPSRQLARRKSKKEKSKQSTTKETKPLLYSPLMLQQFDILGMVPPSTLKDIPSTLEMLRKKASSFEATLKSFRQSEDLIGGVDSGIMSVEHSDSEFTGV